MAIEQVKTKPSKQTLEPSARMEAERVSDWIADAYFDQPLHPSVGKKDAETYIRSRLSYAQTVENSAFARREVSVCERLLEEAKDGNWGSMAIQIRIIGVSLMNSDDPKFARKAIALFKLAHSISS